MLTLLSDLRAILVLSQKLQITDSITLRLVKANVSKVIAAFEGSSVTFSANIDGPRKPQKVFLHHQGKSNDLNVCLE